jgi:hypothetical protein
MAHQRRYPVWLLQQEERLTKRREAMRIFTIGAGLLIAVAEGLLPWDQLTPQVPAWAHISAAALLLPLLYFLVQNDYRMKLEAFTHTLGDLGRRLMFLDPVLESEQFELLESYQGALLRPTQRYLDERLKLGEPKSLRERFNYFYRALPGHVGEAERLGFLSLLHPKTALSWGAAALLTWALLPGYGIVIGAAHGLTLLPLALAAYLLAAHANTRFAYEMAMYNWLRLG